MLSVILKILGILGIILLVLLGLIILVILLVLFFPIFYRIKADRKAAKDSSEFAIHAEVTANWLFGLIRARYKYPDPGVLKIKLLFFTIYDAGADNETAETKKDLETTDNKTTDNTVLFREAQEPVQTETPKQSRSAAKTPPTEEQDKPGGLIEKIQYTIQNFCDKIKNIFEKIKDIRENAEYYREVLMCEDTKELLKYAFMRLGKILKSIRPRKLRANIRFGAASPDTTGYVCAGYGILCSYLGRHVNFTPDFEQAILIGDLYAAGHITVFKVLWNVLMVVKDRRLWELKDKLTRK